MTIEYVDPSVAKVTQMPQTAPNAKVLVGLDEKLVRLSNSLDENLRRIAELNQRLFGSDSRTPESTRVPAPDDGKGLLSSLDMRVAHLHLLVDAISEEMDSLDKLA
ncbi:hypothetical protein HFP57_16850 [Parasphingopyxis algicola]|uniref:hypothetical protein n=1 Tax=Parasphingopyxis algicola TaxID=2026624 RepID=UPI0015A0F5DD|nr:hypothetical protein [Parasphingopyxis algicola]QLC26537.1 hypothetical protein HFP57_16850 [Parasphingopyxis algicola]